MGIAAAAFVGTGIGCAAYGLFVTLAQANDVVKNLLNWWDPVGPLAGKTGMAVLVWLVAWGVLHALWKNKDVDFRRAFIVSMVLIALGFLGTFPPFFEAFGH
jgi:hypothetical protein